jgi:hypothetical protein
MPYHDYIAESCRNIFQTHQCHVVTYIVPTSRICFPEQHSGFFPMRPFQGVVLGRKGLECWVLTPRQHPLFVQPHYVGFNLWFHVLFLFYMVWIWWFAPSIAYDGWKHIILHHFTIFGGMHIHSPAILGYHLGLRKTRVWTTHNHYWVSSWPRSVMWLGYRLGPS